MNKVQVINMNFVVCNRFDHFFPLYYKLLNPFQMTFSEKIKRKTTIWRSNGQFHLKVEEATN